MFCSNCGKEINATDTFCSHCGAAQHAEQTPLSQPSNVLGWYFIVLKKYATFKGRARRKEYWYFVLFSFIANTILIVVDGLIGTLNENTGLGLLSSIYSIGVFLPSIAVSVRRLHDTNRSGWWLLVPIIPFIFLLLDTKPETNKYGAPAR